MFKPLMIVPVFVFAGFVVLSGIGMMNGSDELPSTRIGQPAPTLSQLALQDYPHVTQEDLARGEVTLVNFWASWCPPCRAEHPRLLELAGQDVPIIGVNFRDQEGQAAKYLEDDGNPFAAIAFDPEGRSALDWGVTAPPETFILGPDGTVLFRFQGPLVGSDYEQRFLPAFEKALADAAASNS